MSRDLETTVTHFVSRFLGQTVVLELANGDEVLVTYESLRGTMVRLQVTLPAAATVNAPRDIGYLRATRQLVRNEEGWLTSQPREETP